MSALKSRVSGIIAITGVDFTDKAGYLISFAAGVAAVTASATAPAVAVCLEGNTAAKDTAIAILGNIEGSARMVAGGVIAKGDRVQQKNDGTVITDAGAGNARVVVGVALEAAVAGDLFEVAPISPMILP